MLCYICETGVPVKKVEKQIQTYKGIFKPLDLHYSECTACFSVIADGDQLVKNKQEMYVFKKEVDFIKGGV